MMVVYLILIIGFSVGKHIFTEDYVLEEKTVCLLALSQYREETLPEAKKAQIVLNRTNFQNNMENCEKEERQKNFWQMAESILSHYKVRQLPLCFRQLEGYSETRKLTDETTAILVLDSKACYLPYHQLSSGFTRDGEEVFSDGSFSYLTSVESPWDRQAGQYETTCCFPNSFFRKGKEEKKFSEDISVLSRDEAGYVTKVAVGEEVLSGEEFRFLLKLPSSAFSIEDTDDGVKIRCQGSGHGLGLSQYGAQAMAEEGKNCREILSRYFPKLSWKEA